ncbi:MAG TPA: hypothetical protein VK524_08905 [Polyangiaceae bacterium]|nr:hypothetical protein [Polyangiaceae bacterium]
MAIFKPSTKNVTLCLAVGAWLAGACGSGGVGGVGGSGGTGGRNQCIDTGDTCTPGVPIPRERQCVIGYDCCTNTCICGPDGKVRCNVTCNGNGEGGACGTDAGTGGGGPGTLCDSHSDCHAQLRCCYPCGIPDCHNQCMAPMPDGQCPLFP